MELVNQRYIKTSPNASDRSVRALAVKTRVVLDVNKSERHIRGGMATRENIFINIISDLR